VERGATSIKDKIIALLPDLSRPQDENFHEKFVTGLLPGFLHHGMELLAKPPIDVNVPPTILTKGMGKEEMKSCFFSFCRAEHTVVVVSL
jgi:hypothetical protein